MKIIDGRKIQKELLEEVKNQVSLLSFQPIFTDVLVGQDPASVQYVNIKKRMATEAGILFRSADFSEDITTEELVTEVQKLNTVQNMCGIIIQLPLPPHIDKRTILDAIDPKLDVDCLGMVASNKFYSGETAVIGFPTALACMHLLDSEQINLVGKNIAVLGQGELVGKPVAALLRFRGLEPVCVRSTTENKEELIKNADIIITGIGKGKFITAEKVKEGVVIIDAGTSEEGSGIVGDVDFDSVKDMDGYISPVPGGVGPVTVAMLLRNVLEVAKNVIK